jgi:phage baseplate assembly protein gpV
MKLKQNLGFIILGLALVGMVVVACASSGGTEAGSDSGLMRVKNLYIENSQTTEGLAAFRDQVALAVPTAQGTATPALVIENDSVANSFEIRNPASTPVFYVDVDGNATYTGFSSGGGLVGAEVKITAPTAGATATPALVVDSLAVGANLLEIRDAATPVVTINNGGNVIFGVADGTGIDVTWWSDTTGDYMKWIQSQEQLVITGTNASTVLDVQDGNVVINDNLTVTTGTLTVGVDGTAGDVILYSDTAGANATWSQASEKLTITGVNAQTALDVADGNLVVNDSATVTTGDLTVTAGNLSVGGTTTLTGAVTAATDITLSTATGGGNKGTVSQYIGVPKIYLSGQGTGTNPGSQTIACMDDTPTGEWAEVDAGTNLAVSASTDYFRDVTNSLKVAFTDVVENDGVDGTITEVNLTDMEGLGFWIYSDEAITANWFDVTLDDTNGTDQTYNVATAVPADTWTWVEVDINACDANCDSVNGIQILATAAGGAGLTATNVYIDAVYVWDDADTKTLGDNVLRDGVLAVLNLTDGATLTEWTNYIVRDIESANTKITWVTDLSGKTLAVLYAYQ